MSKLTADERSSRLVLDWKLMRHVNDGPWSAVAYRSHADLLGERNAINDEAQAAAASRYRVTYHVPTLAGPGKFAEPTIVDFDLNTGDYPYNPPATSLPGAVPWSPHFQKGAPVCLGTGMWSAETVLAELVIVIGKLLNWEETLSPGYGGWRPDAVAWHRQHYGKNRLNNIAWPLLPGWLHGLSDAPLFGSDGSSVRPAVDDLFGAGAA